MTIGRFENAEGVADPARSFQACSLVPVLGYPAWRAFFLVGSPAIRKESRRGRKLGYQISPFTADITS
jgi:hypothetical protein